jgi:large repetitive protein
MTLELSPSAFRTLPPFKLVFSPAIDALARIGRQIFAAAGVCALLLLGGSVHAYTQSVSFAGSQTAVGSGVTYPYGVAVDRAGDVFIADRANNRVVEVPSGGGSQTTVPATGLNYPEGLAVDAAGDIFIADQNNNRVVKVPAGGGTQTTVGSGLNTPTGVAVDAAGNVYIADNGNNRVVEVPAGCTSTSCQTTVGTGLSFAIGVAVDGAGDVFIADTYNDRVVEVPASVPQTTVGSGLIAPTGVAVDGAGNVFIAEQGSIVEVPAGGAPQTTVGSGLSSPNGVAVDGAGDVYVTVNGNSPVVEIQLRAANLGSANVCAAEQTTPAPCSQTVTLNYNVNAPTTFGAIRVVTQGAPNLDFTMNSSTCTGTQTSGSSCTVVVTFAPRAPGLRMGAVQLTDSTGNVLVTTMAYGQGLGPAIVFGPGTPTTVGSGLNQPTYAAVDAAGDVFIVDNGNSRVVEVPAGCTSSSCQTTVGSGLNNPNGLAVDGAGDVFISDTSNERLVEVTAGCTSSSCQITLTSGVISFGVAVDETGDIFFANPSFNSVVEIPNGCASSTCQTTLGSGLKSPHGVAVDAAGDVFIADSNNNRVVEVPVGCTSSSCQITVGSGFITPFGVAVDGAGDVFIADRVGDSRIAEVPAGCTSSSCQITVYTEPTSGLSVALDGAGNIFMADLGFSRVVQLQRTQPPALSFAATNVGSTSADSPQSVTVQNIGNQLLNAVSPGLSIGANFAQVAGSGSPADCTSSFSLAPGASCNLSISFTPLAAGNIVSSATFTDNTLNAPANSTSATQSISLQGTATQASQTITFGALSNLPLGTAPFMLSATASSGLVVSFASNTPAVCTVSGAMVTLVASGTCTVQATQAGNTNYAAATPVNQSFQVTDFTLTSTPTSATITAGQTATFTLTATPQGSFTSPISFSCSGLPAMANCTFSPATLTPGSSTVTTTLTIATTAHTAALVTPPFGRRSSRLNAIWLVLPAMLLGMVRVAAPKRRKLSSCCFAFLLVSSCLLQSACGGASASGGSGTPAGSYTVSVTGSIIDAAASTQHIATVTLTVQ